MRTSNERNEQNLFPREPAIRFATRFNLTQSNADRVELKIHFAPGILFGRVQYFSAVVI